MKRLAVIYGEILFSVHTITEAKQSNRQGGARAVDLPAKSFVLARPGVAPLLFVQYWNFVAESKVFQVVSLVGTVK